MIETSTTLSSHFTTSAQQIKKNHCPKEKDGFSGKSTGYTSEDRLGPLKDITDIRD